MLTEGGWDLEESAETGLRRTAVMSEAKCAALLPSEGRYPIDPAKEARAPPANYSYLAVEI